MTNLTRADQLKKIANHQASLESLWLVHPTINEALLMAALRHLHAVIEGDKEAAEAEKRFYWNVEDEL